jgi:hypothetical protein
MFKTVVWASDGPGCPQAAALEVAEGVAREKWRKADRRHGRPAIRQQRCSCSEASASDLWNLDPARPCEFSADDGAGDK